MYRSSLAAVLGFSLLATAAAAQAATDLGAPADTSQVSFELALPLRHTDQLDTLLSALHDPANAQYHHWLTPAQFGAQFGPTPASIARVTAALQARGLTVVPHTRSLHVSGSAAAVQAALSTQLALTPTETGKAGKRLMAKTAIILPPALAAEGATVMAFGQHEAKPLTVVTTAALPAGDLNRYSNTGTYWYNDLKQAYQYPSHDAMVQVNGQTQRLDGTGATIGVLMSSDIFDADVAAMFNHEGFSTTTGMATPTVFDKVHINGGGGLYGGAAIESALDVQQELTGAPGAHVILYDIPDLSDTNIFGGYVQAIEENRVDLLSSSFGGCELSYFPKYNGGQDYRGVLKAYHELFQQGNAQGISFLASSGDEAGRQCPNLAYMEGQPGKFIPSVGFPANDPNVTAVGGGNLVTTYLPGSLDSAYAGENAWSDPEIPYDPYGFGVDAKGGAWGAGSGYSKMWPAPAYQSLVDTGNTAQRAVPDVGMMVGGCPGGIAKTDPKTGQCNGGNKAYNGNGNTDRSAVVVAYGVGIGGGYYGVIGTSVSSPEFAGAMALLIEQQGRMGNLNEYLYRVAAKQARQGAVAKFLHTNIPGYNGVVSSNVSATYNLSTGVGTPVVSALVGAKNVKEAGTPRTPSNP